LAPLSFFARLGTHQWFGVKNLNSAASSFSKSTRDSHQFVQAHFRFISTRVAGALHQNCGWLLLFRSVMRTLTCGLLMNFE
jgi:hypothetical protein